MTLSPIPGRPGKLAVFRKEFRESLRESVGWVRPSARDARVEILVLTGVSIVAATVFFLMLEESDGRPLFRSHPLRALVLSLAVPAVILAFFGLVVAALIVTSSLRDAFYATRADRPVPTRWQRLTTKWSDLAIYCRTLRELRDVRKGGLTLGNTPSLRAGIDDAFREGSRSSSRHWLERRLAAKLLLAGERHRRELQAWLDSDESFHAALNELRSRYGDPQPETRPGLADTVVWVYNGPPRTETSLRLLREFLPGRTEPQGIGVVCTPREVYELLRRADERAAYMTTAYPGPRMRVTPRIGRRSVPLDGADPETVAKLYDPSEESPYSDLSELVAAAKIL
jgi:hypothetical protein